MTISQQFKALEESDRAALMVAFNDMTSHYVIIDKRFIGVNIIASDLLTIEEIDGYWSQGVINEVSTKTN